MCWNLPGSFFAVRSAARWRTARCKATPEIRPIHGMHRSGCEVFHLRYAEWCWMMLNDAEWCWNMRIYRDDLWWFGWSNSYGIYIYIDIRYGEVSTQILWKSAKWCEFQVWPKNTSWSSPAWINQHKLRRWISWLWAPTIELPHLPCRPGTFCALDLCQKSRRCFWEGKPISEFLRFACCIILLWFYAAQIGVRFSFSPLEKNQSPLKLGSTVVARWRSTSSTWLAHLVASARNGLWSNMPT